jgi:hypothetical protein
MGERDRQARNVNHDVVGREVVEDIAFGFVTECEEATDGHKKTGNHGDSRGVVSYLRKAVQSRCFEGAIDQE